MKYLKLLLILLLCSSFAMAKLKKTGLYELRIYHCNEGKLPDLLARFRNHTTSLFEKHGMINIGYWTPTKDGNTDLYYILGYPDKTTRDASWKAFLADPEWQTVAKKSEENGKIIKSIDTKFMTLNSQLTKKLSMKGTSAERVFEMRTYFCYPDKYPNIVTRFKDHTRKIFETHGMRNIAYFETQEKDGAQPTLLYIIAHKSEEASKVSWADFRKDPNWIAVRDASEVSGKIVERVESVYLKPTDFSKIK